MQIEQFYGHTIHPRFLDRESIVLDLGANISCDGVSTATVV